MNKLYDIGLVGLSVMGRSLALNMADHGFRVAGYNRSPEVTDRVLREHPHENLSGFYSLEALVSALERPRKVFLMIQAGPAVDAVLEQLLPLLERGDVVMDGGNSYFEDTNRRAETLAEAGIHYFGVGVSGGEECAPSWRPSRPGRRTTSPAVPTSAPGARGTMSKWSTTALSMPICSSSPRPISC